VPVSFLSLSLRPNRRATTGMGRDVDSGILLYPYVYASGPTAVPFRITPISFLKSI
jgi:hypothetical protein